MKAIMVMFDSLNRNFLPPYGCDWTHAPNFKRLAERTVTFTNSYVGSMPCMPARRELHTGRINFLHRSWGPIEPFDDSMPEILRKNGIHSHLVSDHQHYWEDGGCTYHHRYETWEIVRGQEGDRWKADVGANPMPEDIMGSRWPQDWKNRQYQREEADWPQARTFELGLEFLDRNHDADDWFLQLETFDPHEPFFAPEAYRELYKSDWEGPHFDHPKYGPVTEDPAAREHLRKEYAALLSMCDAYLGKVLDKMDEHGLWDDTMLIVNTDHGFLLGEHDHWAKCVMPFWNEIARTPLFLWDPRAGVQGETRDALVQTIDLAPTLLEYFGQAIPRDMEGKPLKSVLDAAAGMGKGDEVHALREGALFGVHGGHVNVTDGRYVYMRAAATEANGPLYNYTHMPTHMRSLFSVGEMRTVALADPFPFTKDCKTMKIEVAGGIGWSKALTYGTLLYDLEVDPKQENPIQDEAVEQRMCVLMTKLMAANHAPAEQYQRLGLPAPE